jgi:hypothetical protein
MDCVHKWGDQGPNVVAHVASMYYDSNYRTALKTHEDDWLRSEEFGRQGRYGGAAGAGGARRPNAAVRTLHMLRLIMWQMLRTKEFLFGWALLIALLCFCVYILHSQSTSQEGMFNVRGIVFFVFMVSLLLNDMFVDSYARDVVRFVHLRESGVASTPLYLLVLICCLVVSRFLYLATMSGFVYVVMREQTTGNFDFVVLLGVTSFAHATIVYLVTLVLRRPRYATALLVVFDAYMMMFSGFLINITTTPAKSLAPLSLLRWGYGGTLATYLRGRNYTCDGTAVVVANATAREITVTRSYCYTGEEYLQLVGFQDDTTSAATTMMLVIAAVALVLAALRMCTLRG